MTRDKLGKELIKFFGVFVIINSIKNCLQPIIIGYECSGPRSKILFKVLKRKTTLDCLILSKGLWKSQVTIVKISSVFNAYLWVSEWMNGKKYKLAIGILIKL